LVEGLIRFDANFNLKLEVKKVPQAASKAQETEKISCPKCIKGHVLKGKTGYGCSAYKAGCNFVFTFDNIKKIADGKPLTKELVLQIIST
jgi:DNA topoisomerase-3